LYIGVANLVMAVLLIMLVPVYLGNHQTPHEN
jgi:hypothetical protein